MTKVTPLPANISELSKKRYYWLGHENESAQDRFFIEALDSTLWVRGSAEQWDACWYTGMPDPDVFEQLDAERTINHIPGNNALTIKSHLYETLMAAKRHALGGDNERRYQFFPDTYSMPEDYYRYQADAVAEPDALWIQKPKNLSRGRGIEVVKYPSTVPFDNDWLIQRYIKEPHLYDGHKYVLRFYVLITSIEPLRFYWYEEGFAKLASEAYDDTELDNLYRHLTNPDVNEENDNVDMPVTFFSFARYRAWLKNGGHDDEKLFSEFKDLISLTVIAAREKMRHQLDKKEADTRGCYELIGLDCMVDNNLKPWILECNLSPSLETYASNGIEASDEFTVKRQLVHDLVNMMQLNEPVQNYSPEEKAVIENKNRGGFIPLLTDNNANDYLNCFPIPRASDVLFLKDIMIDYQLINMLPNDSSELVFDDSLAIKASDEKERINFLSPNELATWVWLKNAEGLTPPEIASVLSENTPIPQGLSQSDFLQSIQKQVWDTLADWGQAGAFDKTIENDKEKTIAKAWQSSMVCQIDNQLLTIHFFCPVAFSYLKPLLHRVMSYSSTSSHCVMSIYRGQYGYTLILDANIVEEKIKLAELMPAILNAYFKYISESMSFMAAVVAVNKSAILIVSENTAVHLELMRSLGDDVCVLSSFPSLGDSVGMVNTGSLPLIKDVEPVSGEQSIIAYADKTIHILEKNITENESLLLDVIVFVDKNEGGYTVNKLTQAKALSLLWPQFFKTNQATAKALSQWLSDIPVIQYNLSSNINFINVINEVEASYKTVDYA